MKSALLALVLTFTATASFAAEALVYCSIQYTSPNGGTVVNMQHQKFRIPLSEDVVYMDSMWLGDRRFDVSAEDVRQDGWKSLSITLWRMDYPGTLCDQTTGGGATATCNYVNNRNQERANISCTRAQ